MAKRLFEQGALSTITDLTQRLAFGKAGEAAQNITFQNFVTWLNSALGFLKISSDLSDLNDAATARTNLDVYDTTTIDNALNLKSDKTNVLEKDNTTSFTPSSDYHPATKLYVDGGGVQVPWANATEVYANLQGATAVRACKVGAVVYVTGIVNVGVQPAENTVLFTLPISFPLFTETVYFSSGDGNNGEIGEMKALTGTRNIVAGADFNIGSNQYFAVAVPVI